MHTDTKLRRPGLRIAYEEPKMSEGPEALNVLHASCLDIFWPLPFFSSLSLKKEIWTLSLSTCHGRLPGTCLCLSLFCPLRPQGETGGPKPSRKQKNF